MSTTHRDRDKTRRTEQFQRISGPHVMTPERLDRCRAPTVDAGDTPEDHTPAFVVAFQHGIRQDFAAETEHESLAVLYMTADGEQAVLKYVRGLRSDVDRIPRAIAAPDGLLKSAGDDIIQYAPVVRRHPEAR